MLKGKERKKSRWWTEEKKGEQGRARSNPGGFCMEIGIIWKISPRILLVQVLSLSILDKTRGRESCRFIGQGEAEPQPQHKGFGMLWVAQVEITCPAPAGPSSSAGLGWIWDQSMAWDCWDIRDTRAGMSPLGSRWGTAFLSGKLDIHSCFIMDLFPAAAPGCPARELAIIRAGRALPQGWSGFGEPSPHPMVCSALQNPELNLGAKSLLQHKGGAETPEELKIKVQELSECWMSVLV